MSTMAPSTEASGFTGSGMDEATFNGFRELIYQRSGITLGAHKKALVSARVSKRMRRLGLQDAAHYLERVMDDPTGQELIELLDAISTNVTSFYREPAHFTFLADKLRAWYDGGQRRFRIWCAAASTGEEPYTIAMTVCETLGENPPDTRILASDISTRVLQQCVEGVYSQERVANIPPPLLHRYFKRERVQGDYEFHANEKLKKLLTFRRLNLAEPPYPMKGPFDVVLCRNVMIYFDDRVRTALLRDAYRLLKPGGYLMVGHAETLAGLDLPFRAVRPAVYEK